MADTKQYITQNQENGSVLISEDVIVSIVTVAINETEGVAGFTGKTDVLNKKKAKGVRLTISEDDQLYIECNINAYYGYAVVNVAKAVQDNVAAAVESMTGMNVTEVNVNICGIVQQ